MLVPTASTIALLPFDVCAEGNAASEIDAIQAAQGAFIELCALQPGGLEVEIKDIVAL
jgi:hypothetical protein